MSTFRPDHTDEFDPEDISRNKGAACVSYLGPLFLIPLLSAPDSRFAKFHANQGLLLFLVSIACGVILGFITFVVSLVFFWSGFIAALLTGLISSVFGLLFLVVIILLLVEASNGKARELPIIGKYKIIS